MTSARYLWNWIKEAGRGHVTAFLSWGGFFIYIVVTIFALQSDSYSTFSGIGSESLLYLSMGLGVLAAAAGFCYLEQPVKLDFYYSLPVKRGTIFWSKYIHGIVQVLFPLFISMAVCGFYECSINRDFVAYAGYYVLQSAVLFSLVVLIFYHISIVSFLAGGRFVTVLVLFASFIYGGQVVFQGIGNAYAKYFFKTFYRIPELEAMKEALTPEQLARKLTGAFLHDKIEALEYVPEKEIVLAAFFWILLFAVLMVCLERKRKVENVGKVFAFSAAERAFVFFVSVVLALLFGNLAMGYGILLVFLFHILAEMLIQRQGNALFRRKWQMAAECALVLLMTEGFAAGAKAFNDFSPERDEVSAVRICVNGMDMSQAEYEENFPGKETYETERKLEQFKFTEEGLAEGLFWIRSLKEKAETDGKAWEYSFATVCYEMKDGRQRYRVYPVDEVDLQSFSRVFETKEYKEKAYPALLWENVGDNRFAWKDGVCNQILKLTKEEKEVFLKLYKEEVLEFRMEELREAAPSGIVEMNSDKWGETEELLIYPFFEKTCAFLKEHEEIREDLLDYPVQSLKVKEDVPDRKEETYVGDGYAGGVRIEHYETEEELKEWRGRLVWTKLDVQPLLCPLGYRGGIEADVEEPESGAVVNVKCCEMMETSKKP